MSELMGENPDRKNLSFETAAYNYIESKSAVLSPSTYREYKNSIKRYSPEFLKKNIYDITLEDIQKEINEFSKTRSPKTVRNYNAFISSVIGFYRKGVQFPVSLPQRVRKEPHIPTDEEVRLLISEIKGSRYEVAIRLACYGLRRSEICALTIDDLEGNILTIDKALVLATDGKWVVKTTKTTESTRKIKIDDDLADLIRQKGYIYKGHPNNFYDYLSRTQDRLELEHFSIHKLRHYYASMSHAIGIPDSYIMKGGGWKTDTVLKNVYRHALSDKQEEAMDMVAKHLSELK
jgi:integrase